MENSKEKQIEEMAKALTTYEKKLCDRLPKDKCLLTSAVHAQVSCDYCKIAEFLVNAGYRKATDLAEEISRDIIEPIWEAYKNSTNKETVLLVAMICEGINHQLKKKYTESEKDK